MKQSMSWLTYSKMILRKVSFDRSLFSKELTKSLKRLKREEILALEQWCVKTFPIALALTATQIIQSYLELM